MMQGIQSWCSVRIYEGWDGELGGRITWQGGICILMADSCLCMAETITIFQSNFPPIKNKNKNFKKSSASRQAVAHPGDVAHPCISQGRITSWCYQVAACPGS